MQRPRDVKEYDIRGKKGRCTLVPVRLESKVGAWDFRAFLTTVHVKECNNHGMASSVLSRKLVFREG